MWDSTALAPKLPIPNQQFRSTSVSPISRQKRARYGAPLSAVGQGLCSAALQSLEWVEFVEPFLLLFFAARFVTLIAFRRRGLFLLAIRRGSAGIGARLYLRRVGHIIGLCRSFRGFL